MLVRLVSGNLATLESPPDRITIDGAEYVRAYPVASGRCAHCGGVSAGWTADRILAAIRKAAERAGGIPPRAWQWEKVGKTHPSSRTAQDMFGSWSNAVRAAGYEPARHGGQVYWTRERIVAALDRWANEHGTPPKAREWMASGPWWPSHRSVLNRFGSWNAAMTAAGFLPRGPYGVRLKRTAERSRLLSADTLVEPVARYLADGVSPQTLSELSGVDEAVIRRLSGGRKRFLREETAEALCLAIGREDLMVAA